MKKTIGMFFLHQKTLSASEREAFRLGITRKIIISTAENIVPQIPFSSLPHEISSQPWLVQEYFFNQSFSDIGKSPLDYPAFQRLEKLCLSGSIMPVMLFYSDVFDEYLASEFSEASHGQHEHQWFLNSGWESIGFEPLDNLLLSCIWDFSKSEDLLPTEVRIGLSENINKFGLFKTEVSAIEYKNIINSSQNEHFFRVFELMTLPSFIDPAR